MRVQIAAPINTGSVIYNKDLVVDPIFSSYMDNLLGFGGKVTDIRQFINAPRPFRYRTYEFDLSNHSKELTKMYDCSCEGILGRFLISSEGGILFELSFSVENNDSERIAEGQKLLHKEFEQMFAPIARKIESGIMAFCRENQDSIEKFQFNNIHSTIFSWKYFSYFVKNVENMSDTEIKKLLLVTGEIDTFKANGNSQYLIGWESSISEIGFESKFSHIITVMSFLWQEYYNLDLLLDSELVVLRNDFLKGKFHHANQKYIRVLKIYSDITTYKFKESNFSMDMEDIRVFRSVGDSWEIQKLRDGITTKIQNLHDLYQIVLDEQKERHSTILNYTVGAFTLLGFIGLIVSILQFYDFDNHIFTKIERLNIITYSFAGSLLFLSGVLISFIFFSYGKRKR